jgi:hypothetical protein
MARQYGTSILETTMTVFRRGLAAFVLGGAYASLPACAQGIKPGLWEITNNVSSADGRMQAAMADMQKQFAQMDPEQRKMVEQMMAKQGVQLGVGGGGLRTRMCMTREMAARSEVPVQQQGDCTHKRSPGAGGTMKISFTCTNPRTSGEGEVSFQGDTGYRMKMKMMSDASGTPETMTMDASARWLGADCGNVRPMAMPQAR